MCLLAICMSPWEKCLFRSSAHLVIDRLFSERKGSEGIVKGKGGQLYGDRRFDFGW